MVREGAVRIGSYGRPVRALLDLVAPDRCVACEAASDGELCRACAAEVAILASGCERCGNPRTSPRAPCPCQELGSFRRARSLVVFAEPARSLTLALKRRARPSTISAVGDLLAALARREGLVVSDTVVTHVPAGRAAARRGFDHAGLIARATATALGVRAARLLVRAREGPRQADVPLDRRRANVAGRFAARSVDVAVLLVDDVYTTGATAEACAEALTKAGAASVDVLTWARTLRRRG
jgi:predicted amidophosphoribosyltransferase